MDKQSGGSIRLWDVVSLVHGVYVNKDLVEYVLYVLKETS